MFFFVKLGELDLQRPKINGEKEKSPVALHGLIEHVCKRSGSISNIRLGHLDSCAQNMCNLRSYVLITSFQYGSTLDVNYNLILAIHSSQIFEYLRRMFYSHALEHLQNRKKKRF